jgi:hypothetical protein
MIIKKSVGILVYSIIRGAKIQLVSATKYKSFNGGTPLNEKKGVNFVA